MDEKLGQHTTYRPHIHFIVIALTTQNQLWGSVPKGHYFVSIQALEFAFSAQSKVSQFDISFIPHQDIGGFDVPMHQILFMQIVDTFKELFGDALDLRQGKPDFVFEEAR